jgi:hypothetical protein
VAPGAHEVTIKLLTDETGPDPFAALVCVSGRRRQRWPRILRTDYRGSSHRPGDACMTAEVFGVNGGVAVVVGLLTLVPIWALIDAVSRPSAAFYTAGSHKGAWIGVILVLWLLTGVLGGLLSIWYLLSVRPKVRRARLSV